MTTINQATENCRTDDRGRVRVPVERREELLREFDRSGISAMKFARLAGVKYATFANWRQKRRRAKEEGEASEAAPQHGGQDVGAAGGPVRLFEVFGEPPRRLAMGGAGLRVEFPGGACVMVETPAQLPMVAELLALAAQNARARC